MTDEVPAPLDRVDIEGVSLRDYFAGQALTGILSKTIPLSVEGRGLVAADAYHLADAMLTEREKFL